MQNIAVITGTSSGIGQSLAQLLLDKDWQVFGISRKHSKLLSSNHNFHQVICDLSLVDNLEHIIDELPEKIDALINNAGSWELMNIENATLGHINKMIDINLRTPIYLTTLLIPRINPGGHIINVSSILSQRGETEYGIYSAAKAGIDRFTTTLSRENEDLHVTAVLPTATDTPGNRIVLGESEDYSAHLSPENVSKIMVDILNNKYPSGSLIVINNAAYKYLWEERDKYIKVEL